MRDSKVDRRWYDDILDSLAADPVRDESDKRCLARGMRFSRDRAQHVCDFFPDMLTLYEGRMAGKPFNLMPWQVEILGRVFGWEKYSDFCKRWVRRFRKASIWVPKKNGKSPTAAGVGLYLFCADGEPGQKVFTAARDGKQALIVHTHAKKMVRSSPYLSVECRINNSTNVISHEPTDSTYALLSGDNIEGQEGLNGSVIIDEVHVVDDRLAGRLEGMGISRDEPLQFEVSTAGDNPLGYGRRQYEYGQSVRDGFVEDDGFFFQTYEAPHDATDEELMNPEMWQRANPSWGITINAEEMAESLKRAHRSAVDWQRAKMYRFNIWASASEPWIRAHHWAACREEFEESHLHGRSCYLGLDLARTTDTSAVSLVFPEVDGTYWLLPYFWLPEKQVENLSAKVPQVKDWVKRGLIRMTPDATTDYRAIEADIRELSQRFQIQAIIYDDKYANELTQDLVEGNGKDPGIGCDRHPFAQTLMNFASPTAAFERLIIDGKLRHNGNSVLTWQVGNTRVKSDNNQNYRPVKQSHGDYRTIDSVVAAIMALAGAIHNPHQTSVYESSGNLGV